MGMCGWGVPKRFLLKAYTALVPQDTPGGTIRVQPVTTSWSSFQISGGEGGGRRLCRQVPPTHTHTLGRESIGC